MSNNLNQSEKDLQNLIEDYQPEYSSEAWDRLNKSLPVKSYKWYYVAASVLIGAVAMFYSLNTDVKQSQATFSQDIPLVNEAEAFEKENIIEIIEPNIEKENNSIKQKDNSFIEKEKVLNSNKEKETIEPVSNQLLVAVEAVKELEIDNAESIKQQQLVIAPQIKPEIVLSTHSGCEPLDVEFSVKDIPEGSTVSWDLGNGNTCQKLNFKHEYLKSGNYTVKLNVSTSTDNYSVEEEILVKASPKAEFIFSIEEAFLVFENLSQNYETIEWEFLGIFSDEKAPNFEMLYSGTYPVSVKVINDANCFDIVRTEVIYEVDHKIFAPNAFTPDGDGYNDEFIVKHEIRSGFTYTLQIFNAMGVKLFETQDSNRGWDGTVAGHMQNSNQEKYTWVLTIADPRGVSVCDKGTFQKLMR